MRLFDLVLDLANTTFGRAGNGTRPSVLMFRTTFAARNNIWSGYPLSLQRGDTVTAGVEDYNILFNALLGAGLAPGPHTLSSDPRFANPAASDFTLAPNSPAIDSGDGAGLPGGFAQDRNNLPRRVDVAAIPDTGAGAPPFIDRGAHERPNDIATATPTRTATATVTVTRTATPTVTRTPTATATQPATPTRTPTATATQPGAPTPTRTPTGTVAPASRPEQWLPVVLK
jgi:hypothetical protein